MNGEKEEKAKKLIETALAHLAQALAQGRSEALTAYLNAIARFHRYSFQNMMLILSQRPDATYVAGFNAWKKLRRFVKKGEAGILIFAPIRPRHEETPDDDTRQDADERARMRFKAAYVFDISQTDGEPLPEFSRITGHPRDYTARLKALLTADGIRLEYTEDIPGLGQSRHGVILLQPDLSPAEEFSVLVHELAHEKLHWNGRKTSKSVRETEAEAVAFAVCHAIGLEPGSSSPDYIQLHQGDLETFRDSLTAIQRTARHIIEALIAGDDAEETPHHLEAA